MKKVTRKLMVCSETVRMLNHIDLMPVRGGDAPANAAKTNTTESGMDCPAQAVVVVPTK
jgi:hypothetical protein